MVPCNSMTAKMEDVIFKFLCQKRTNNNVQYLGHVISQFVFNFAVKLYQF